jgi:hypothetical protein
VPHTNRTSALRSRSASDFPYAGIAGLLDKALLGGGDTRLAIDPVTGLNNYGCSPRPRADVLEFSSSTASTISDYAYERAASSYQQLLNDNSIQHFDELVEQARDELRQHIGLWDEDADIVFAPSGTDAQLIALFLMRATLGTPLVSVVVGSDQTGSGTTYTAQGKNFIDHGPLKEGEDFAGLSDGVSSISIPFFDAHGKPRTMADLDSATMDAVQSAISAKSHVLLQVMASSKLGWSAPSDACVDEIVRRWPDKVRIVSDACQARLSSSRLRRLLRAGQIVIATGSKFFGGPAFSGALFIPASMRAAIEAITDVPEGLRNRSRLFDWPKRWANLRGLFSSKPNIGQWLRWEAALEEMRSYYAIPLAFRCMALHQFAQFAPDILSGCAHASALECSGFRKASEEDEEFSVPSIFPFFVRDAERYLSAAETRDIHRALHGGAKSPGDQLSRKQTMRFCVGQPVTIDAKRTAVLRVSSSARFVIRCWSSNPILANSRIRHEIGQIKHLTERLSVLVGGKSVLQPQAMTR